MPRDRSSLAPALLTLALLVTACAAPPGGAPTTSGGAQTAGPKTLRVGMGNEPTDGVAGWGHSDGVGTTFMAATVANLTLLAGEPVADPAAGAALALAAALIVSVLARRTFREPIPTLGQVAAPLVSPTPTPLTGWLRWLERALSAPSIQKMAVLATTAELLGISKN